MKTMKIYMGCNKASLPDGAVGATAGFRGGFHAAAVVDDRVTKAGPWPFSSAFLFAAFFGRFGDGSCGRKTPPTGATRTQNWNKRKIKG